MLFINLRTLRKSKAVYEAISRAPTRHGVIVYAWELVAMAVKEVSYQEVCKPGSVSVWSSLCEAGYPTPDAVYPEGRRATSTPPVRPCSRWGLPGRHVSMTPVRSYRTISPLPMTAVYFLWHFPSGRPARTLSGIAPCGARTFLCRPIARTTATTRPPDS